MKILKLRTKKFYSIGPRSRSQFQKSGHGGNAITLRKNRQIIRVLSQKTFQLSAEHFGHTRQNNFEFIPPGLIINKHIVSFMLLFTR
jgi:hypothetical protein